MEINADFIEATGLFTRHGFTVSPAAHGEDRDNAEVIIDTDHSVVGAHVDTTWSEDGESVVITTEYDPEDYWTD